MIIKTPKYRFHYQHDEIKIKKVALKALKKRKISYNFFNHFHPFVGKLLEQLNKKSLAGLMDVEFQEQLKLENDFFEKEYKPNKSDEGFEVNYFNGELDLGEGGAYSVYNWELFFHVPLTIAIHLSKNQRFAEAQKWFHYIFDPTSNDKSVGPPKKFWKFLQFRKKSDVELINQLLTTLSQPEDSDLKKQIIKSIEGWRHKPFQPHVVARTRFLAYQFNVVMKYLDNLIAWGDHLFRQDTMETINEATQVYILAANILGPKPQEIPRRGKIQPKTYAMLKDKLDAFGNALVEMEGEFPFNLNIPVTKSTEVKQTNSLFGIGKTLYFCIPQNDKLLGYWDIVADRLFKIRHCMNIEGIVRQLPLFQPPIDPGMLVKAAAAGIDISSIVSGLNQPLAPVRSGLFIQKALEICSEVRSLGGALLSALEKRDTEALGLLRQKHEINIQQLAQDVRYLQWKEAESATESLLKSRDSAVERYRFYQRMLGGKEEDLKAIKEFTLERPELTEENFDEVYAELVGQYGQDIAGQEYPAIDIRDGGKLYLNRNEDSELNVHMPNAKNYQLAAYALREIAPIMSLIPDFPIDIHFWGMGATIVFGGSGLTSNMKTAADILELLASRENQDAGSASKKAGYERRAYEWMFQGNLAARELMQIGRQIISSLIKEQTTKKEYENHKKQIEQSIEMNTFLKDKFTNKDLYTWIQGEISKLYYDCYKFAFDIARKAEQTMKQELMRKELDDMDFIKFNYWDSGRKGLLSGETLYLDLKRMEMAYHEHNKREYEMTKHISLQQLNPLALLQLKATGSCEVTVPEWLLDLDCPGHYMRRIKTVSVSIPCVAGPHTGINCTLSLLKSTIRKSPILKDGEYKRDGSEDDRFKDSYGTIQSIVTSNAQNDSGMFETNLRDERYLPFEGAGAISTWKIQLPSDLRQFDYNTISDLILHLRYTAREGGSLLKTGAVSEIDTMVKEEKTSPLVISFSLRHNFPTQWHQFVNSTNNEDLKITIKKDHFPYLAQGFTININKITLFSNTAEGLKNRDIDINKLEGDINEAESNNQSKLSIEEGTEVLTRDKDEQVFLVLSYWLE